MAAVTEDPISLWLKLGALDKLEQVVLDGYGDQLYGKTSRIPQVNKFLRQVPLFQNKIDEIHRAVCTGNLREVQLLIDRKKLAFCRDQSGASPMHKAVLFSQKPIIFYLLDRFPNVVQARDHRGRTPLHYSAVLPDNGEIFRFLLEHGADPNASDVYGNRAEYYLQAQDEMTLETLKESSGSSSSESNNPIENNNNNVVIETTNDEVAATDSNIIITNNNSDNIENLNDNSPTKDDSSNISVVSQRIKDKPKKQPKIRKFQFTGSVIGRQRSARPAGTRVQIRELINGCSLDALEELVIQGHGDKLLGESAPNLLIQDFINMVPVYMERIYDIHRAVARGKLREVQILLDRKKFALARDPLGATPLHKAVLYNHLDITLYIAQNFPLTRDAKDLDGRTALHYAAGHKDNHEVYNLLISLGANPIALDYRGKTAEFYLQYPEHFHLEQIVKNSQRANANYMANNTNRMKLASPKRKSPYPPKPTNFFPFDSDSEHLLNMDTNGAGSNDEESNGSLSLKLPKKTLFRGQPPLPPARLKRIEINSANIKKWVREEDVEKLEGAILEGFGDKVAKQKSSSAHLQKYIDNHVPMMLRKIEAIHSSVSNDDVLELQKHLDQKDHMVLAKDALGMAPIHRSVLMNKVETLRFLIDTFPETVNAKDKEGRTALHYAAAMSRDTSGSNCNLYRMLLQAGADSRIRDNQGRSAEYYRTHHVPIPNKLAQLPKADLGKKLRSKSEPPPQHRMRRKPLGPAGASVVPQVVLDKVGQWIQNGEMDKLKEFVHEGHGHHLLGRTSWNEEVRQYLKSIPTYLVNLEALFTATASGDVGCIDKILTDDETLLKARNGKGSTIFHHAVFHNRLNVINYFLDNHPTAINTRDKFGRSPLHVAGQQKHDYIFNVLLLGGADSMMLDNKGRSAEFYLNSSVKPRKSKGSSSEVTPEDSNEERIEPENDKEQTPEEETREVEEVEERQEPEEKEVEEQNEVELESEEVGKVESEEVMFEGEPSPEENESQSKPTTQEKIEAEEMFEEQEEKPEPENEVEKIEENEEKENEEVMIEKDEERGQTEDDDENKENEKEITPPADARAPNARRNSSGDRLTELIELWIQEKDLLRLEHVVIAGQGERLVGRTSDDRQVQEFLELVPTYMARIRGVHDAVVRGNLGEVESVLTRKRFALSRDHLGASPLHLAVLHGHADIVQYIVNHFPEALDGPDNEGRTPLHYAAVVRDGGNCYRTLKRSGADESIIDKAGRVAEYYLTHPGCLTIRDLLESYRIPDPTQRRPSQVNIWQRPPTQEMETTRE